MLWRSTSLKRTFAPSFDILNLFGGFQWLWFFQFLNPSILVLAIFSNSRTSKLNLNTKFDSMYMLYKLQYQGLYEYKVLQQIKIWVYIGMEFNT